MRGRRNCVILGDIDVHHIRSSWRVSNYNANTFARKRKLILFVGFFVDNPPFFVCFKMNLCSSEEDNHDVA